MPSDNTPQLDMSLPARIRAAVAECNPPGGGTNYSTILLDGTGKGSYGDRLVAVALEAADALSSPSATPTRDDNGSLRESQSGAEAGTTSPCPGEATFTDRCERQSVTAFSPRSAIRESK
jgi:hypothetical protein